jgi:hypothetical protein
VDGLVIAGNTFCVAGGANATQLQHCAGVVSSGNSCCGADGQPQPC